MGHKVKQSLMSSRIDFFYYAFRNVLLVSVLVLAVSAFVLGFSVSHSSATDGSGVDKVTLSIPVSCTLNATINSEHTISMVSGTYKDNIGKTTMKTTCNDKDGYVIYAIGSTNDIDGKSTLSSIDLGEDYDIPTGLNTSKPSTGEDVSSWAMKLTPVAGNYTPVIPTEYNNTYGLIPNTWTNVASRDPGTFDMQEGSTFTTTYAIYTKGTQPAGTYTGQVKFALLHPSSSISPTTLERAFFLAGKQKINIYDENGTNTANSTNQATGEPNTLIGSYYKMQDMTTAICDTANITGEASQVQLLDIRDNNIYWATKLLDGHCWMTQNLDLDLDSSVALTSENTDLNVIYDPVISTTNYLEYKNGYINNNGIIEWLPNKKTATETSDWSNSNTTPSSLDIGNGNLDIDLGNHNSVGNYYNWTSSIASNNSSSLSNNTYININNNPQNSICAKNWQLPIVTSYSSNKAGENNFANLDYYYNDVGPNNSDYLQSSPLYFTKSGRIESNGGTAFFNNDGYYWSSTTTDANKAANLYFERGINKLDNSRTRSYGFSIRCIAR